MQIVSLEKSIGSGRPVVLLYDSSQRATVDSSERLEQMLALELSQHATVHLLRVAEVLDEQLEASSNQLLAQLAQIGIRQACFVTIGRCSTLLWKVALQHQKKIRNALIINGETRPKSSRFERVLQKVESCLPLGLPFRVSEGKFYALPFLERFRFPVIVVALRDSSDRVKSESTVLAQALPIAWRMNLESKSIVPQLSEAYQTLLRVPAKRPQKRRNT